MIYGFGMLYQIIDKYFESDIDEMEHAFICTYKWPDSYVLKIYNDTFWDELQEVYDIHLEKEVKKDQVTIGDLKKIINYYSM